MAANDPHELSWQAPEFEHRPKSVTWYWMTIIIALLLLAFAFWQADYFFAVFIVIGELLLLVWANKEPPMITFTLNQRGLTIRDTKFYPFSDIKNWSADTQGFFDPEWPDFTLHLGGHFQMPLKIKVPVALLTEVERIFRSHAKEVPFEPTLMDSIEKFLGF